VFDELPTYLIDVLEEMGDDAARRCYWDMGPWSDLLRVWRPLGIPASRVTFKVGSDALACETAARAGATLRPSPSVHESMRVSWFRCFPQWRLQMSDRLGCVLLFPAVAAPAAGQRGDVGAVGQDPERAPAARGPAVPAVLHGGRLRSLHPPAGAPPVISELHSDPSNHPGTALHAPCHPSAHHDVCSCKDSPEPA